MLRNTTNYSTIYIVCLCCFLTLNTHHDAPRCRNSFFAFVLRATDKCYFMYMYNTLSFHNKRSSPPKVFIQNI